MSVWTYMRGNKVVNRGNGVWQYEDGARSTKERPCPRCGSLGTPDGHDACLGTLPNVLYACCGHGHDEYAYVVFCDGSQLRGADALRYFNRTKSVIA